jgi:hypothetical protein
MLIFEDKSHIRRHFFNPAHQLVKNRHNFHRVEARSCTPNFKGNLISHDHLLVIPREVPIKLVCDEEWNAYGGRLATYAMEKSDALQLGVALGVRRSMTSWGF